MIEPWLRGTLTEVDAIRRQVLHALELAEEDVSQWCSGLTDAEMNVRPFGLAPVSFHLRHIRDSLDRLLTYAEGHLLSGTQFDALNSEMDGEAFTETELDEFNAGLGEARRRILLISSGSYEDIRRVGRAMLPSTIGGLLVHCAEHTQRHVGQIVITAKVIVGMKRI
jgi:hypothetical protein